MILPAMPPEAVFITESPWASAWFWFGMFGCATAALVVAVSFQLMERTLVGITQQLQEIKASLDEASSEIVTKIGDLEDSLANAGISEQDQTLLDEIRSAAQELADIVPNAVEAESDSDEPNPDKGDKPYKREGIQQSK